MELTKILNRCLIVPLDTQTEKDLEQACRDYASEATEADFETCARIYMFNEHNDAFVRSLHNKYKENTSKGLSVPYIVNRGLAGYVLSLLLDDSVSTLDDDLKARIALYVKNISVCLKTRCYELPVVEVITDLFKYAKEAYNAETELDKPAEMLLYPAIFSVSDFDEADIDDKNKIFEEVKYLAKKVERFEYKEKLANLPKPKAKTLFVDAYHLVENMNRMSEWLNVDTNPLATIYSVLGKFTKEAKLAEIKSLLDGAGVVLETASTSQSSVLLRCLKGEDTLVDMFDVALTAYEFAAYVYHELQFERLIKNDNE